MNPAVGADIESICRKCGDVWHVVVAKEGDKIAKVQCKQCSGYHRYKPPPSAKAARSGSRRATSSSSTRKAQSVSARFDEPQVAANVNKPVALYRHNETYEPGDRIDHPKFGQGVVELTNEPGKMQVFFPDGRRWLAVAKPKSAGLQRPKPFGNDPDKGPPKW